MTKLRLLHLQIAQAEKALSKAQNNVYSNHKLDDYQRFLVNLFAKIQDDVQQPNFSPSEIEKYKGFVEFIFKNLEYLEGSTLNFAPFELVFCLNLALKDWLIDQEYVIVTNLSNNINTFHFDPWLLQSGSQIFQEIMMNYDEKPNVALVQVTLPSMLVRDYLTSIVLYHELGHFVDEKYKISLKLAKILADAFYFKDTEDIFFEEFEIYFDPRYLDSEHREQHIKNYLAEYFCDLFAAQYLGKGYMEYLFYVSGGAKRHMTSHPSSIMRQKVYDAFVRNEDNPIVDFFQKYIPKEIPEGKFKQRYVIIKTTEFCELLPATIPDDKTLHGIFSYGWETWLSGWKNSEYLSSLPPEKVYSIVNNLMEKSIGNYIVQSLWKSQS